MTNAVSPIAQSGGGGSAAPFSGSGGMPAGFPQAGAGGSAPPVLPPGGGAGGGPGGVTTDPDAWTNFGGSLEQTFARPNTMLQESNLSRIGIAKWSGTAPGGVTGTPAVYKGIVYWADWVGNVHAQDIVDGAEQWNPTVKLEVGVTSSPAVTERFVYLADRFNAVHALDRATGKEEWKTVVSDSKLAQLWSSPVIADGVLIVGVGCKGTSDGTSGAFPPADLMMFRGAVVGLDAETGKERWRFENTIGADGTRYGPGVSSWSSAAVDTVRKVAYIGTGNSYYPEASPYSDSLLALRYLTTNPKGELAWHEQFTKNDNYTTGNRNGPDFDVGATPNLFSLDGKDYVAVGDKGGRFYILDRETGTMTFTTELSRGSSTGGVMAPAAYDNGVLYVTSNSRMTSTVVAAIDARMSKVKWSRTVGGVSYGAPLLLKDVLLIGTTGGFPSGREQPGQLTAHRISDGTPIDWKLPLKYQRGGGLSLYRDTLFVSYGYVFENTTAERSLQGGVLVATLDGMPPPRGGPEQGPTYAPTYRAVYDELLQPNGCTAGFCHDGTGLQIAEAATGYTNLMQGTSSDPNCAGMKFIVPGQPEQSYLYQKLRPAPKCGVPMPKDGAPLSAEFMTQIRTWIERGAPMN